MNSPELKAFIREKKDLFWYIPDDKKEQIDPGIIVESVLNYGTLEDISTLIKIMGLKKVRQVFFNARERQKMNYFPEVYNFFSLWFNKNV
jgi:hypothetical protein